MKVKRIISTVLLCTFMFTLLFVFSGCKKEEVDKVDKVEQESVKGEEKDIKTQEPVEINVGHWLWRPDYADKVIAAFNEKYPNIKVNYEFMEYEQYVNKLKINLASGGGFDVFVTQSGALLESTKSYCEPLTQYVEKSLGSNWKDKFIDESLDSVIFEEGVVGIPDSVSFAGMLYVNVDKMNEYSLEPPKTYEQLKLFAQTLRDNGDLPLMIGAKDQWIILDLFNVIANDIAPGKIYMADRGEIPWTDNDLIKAFEAWKKLFDDKIFQDGTVGVPQYPTVAEMYWQKGKGGALFDGDWAVGTFTVTDESWSEPANKYKQMVMPFPDMSGDGNPCPVSFTPGHIWSINSNSTTEKKEAAWKLINWYIAEEGISLMNSKEIGVVLKPAFKDIEVTFESDRENFKNCMNDIMSFSQNVGGDRELTNPDVKKVLGEVLQEIAVGMDPVKGAKKVQDAAAK